ncbi:WD40 repeat domain-containing protein [Streptomyces sp. NPDC001795]|uniref:WD40 repeat domain-containing protein n=1 Tax=unclassified Streptomyces TaxID=2593676 RepID=UPI00332FD578
MFSPDGRTLAAGSEDGRVQLWNTSTGRATTLIGHTGVVTSVAFSRDGHTVASSSEDGTVRLWDTSTGRTRTTLTGHDDPVSLVAFRPDGRTLVTVGEDGTTRLWDVKLPDQATAIKKICQAVGRDLTPEERGLYLAGQTPSPVCPT